VGARHRCRYATGYYFYIPLCDLFVQKKTTQMSTMETVTGLMLMNMVCFLEFVTASEKKWIFNSQLRNVSIGYSVF